MSTKIILVGQAPGASPGEPLEHHSGRRLSALADLDHDDFLERFERVNLLDEFPGKDGRGDAFDAKAARARADQLRAGWAGRRAVLLGRGVAAAFRLVPDDYEWFKPIEVPPGIETVVMPHPSGISTWWNDEVNVESARQFMRRLNVGFLAPIVRARERKPNGAKEQFTPEQVIAALYSADGILTQAARVLSEETGLGCDRQTVANYCDRYPDLQKVRDRCRETIGDIAEQNVWRAVRERDAEISMKLLRCKMFADRGYGLQVEGRLRHEGRVDHRHVAADPLLAKLTKEQLEALEGVYEVLSIDGSGENSDMPQDETARPARLR